MRFHIIIPPDRIRALWALVRQVNSSVRLNDINTGETMKITTVFLIVFLQGALLFGQSADTLYTVDSIQALLFYNGNNSYPKTQVAGTFSPNIIDNKDFTLYNTIIGEGSAQGSSRQTLVVVKIIVTPSMVDIQRRDSFRRISFQVEQGDKEIFKRTDEFYIEEGQKEYFMAYMIYGTGKSKFDITAEIINKGKVESKLHKTLPFALGE